MTDNARFIVQAAHERAGATLCRAQQALRRLDRAGATVNVQAVAQAASVSRSWIYRHPAIRAEIENLRSKSTRSTTPSPPSAERASNDSLQRRLETGLDEIRRLKEENAELRDQVARMFGDQRHAQRGSRP